MTFDALGAKMRVFETAHDYYVLPMEERYSAFIAALLAEAS